MILKEHSRQAISVSLRLDELYLINYLPAMPQNILTAASCTPL